MGPSITFFYYLCDMIHLKKLFVIVLVMVGSTLLYGCHHGDQGYDVRLIAADSIMHDDAAMALDLLNSIKEQSLVGKRDRAYYALLLSQARYRNYIVATSDSLIDVALDYYNHHQDEKEKLTRAYIYKGAVMEELGDNQQALINYKNALTCVTKNDYFNQGYARLRLGYLYRINIVADSDEITLYKDALHYFKQVPDSFYIAVCLNEIGTSYITRNNDSVLPCLEQGLTVARSIGAKRLEWENLRTTAEFKMYSKNPEDIETSKQIALSLLRDGYNPDEREWLSMIAVYSLARQNKPDSANYYLKQVSSNQGTVDYQVFYQVCRAEVAKSQGNIEEFLHFFKKADELSDSLVRDTSQHQLREMEAKYDNETLKNENLRYKMILIASILGGLLLLSCLAIALLVIKHRFGSNRQLLKESEITIERLRNDAERLSERLDANRAMSDRLKDTIKHQIDTFTQLVAMHNKQFQKDPKSFSIVFKQSYMINQPDTSFWSGIRAYVNSTHNGIIDHLEELHPSTLKDSDIHYLCLYCSGLPSSVVMLCMGYNDIHSLYNKKRRIMNKLGLSLDDSLTKDVLNEYLASLGARVVNESDGEMLVAENESNKQ